MRAANEASRRSLGPFAHRAGDAARRDGRPPGCALGGERRGGRDGAACGRNARQPAGGGRQDRVGQQVRQLSRQLPFRGRAVVQLGRQHDGPGRPRSALLGHCRRGGAGLRWLRRPLHPLPHGRGMARRTLHAHRRLGAGRRAIPTACSATSAIASSIQTAPSTPGCRIRPSWPTTRGALPLATSGEACT